MCESFENKRFVNMLDASISPLRPEHSLIIIKVPFKRLVLYLLIRPIFYTLGVPITCIIYFVIPKRIRYSITYLTWHSISTVSNGTVLKF